MDVVTTTIVDCSGVGVGGITRVLTEVVRHWPTGHRVRLVAAPVSWSVPSRPDLDVEIVSRQSRSRRRTIMEAGRAVRRATPRRLGRTGSVRILSLSPSLAVLGSRLPVTTVVHDLAFQLWPHGLSRSVRSYRRASYSVAIRRSQHLLCVSGRTRHDLLGLYGVRYDRSAVWAPGSNVVSSLGALPPRLAQIRDRGGRYLLIAGHAAHKGVDLALEALPRLTGYEIAVLTGGQRVPRFNELAAGDDRVVLLDHLPDPDYAATVAGAAAFLMPSHFEGYGLPAVEALRLGTPTVISPDPALYEATEASAVRMTSWTADALVTAVDEAVRLGPPARPPGRTWAEATGHLYELLYGAQHG